MKLIYYFLLFVSVTPLLSACSAEDDGGKDILQRGLKGKILYASCATTAVQILNKDMGTSWTNCHDQKDYENVVNAVIINRNDMPLNQEFSFNIIEDEKVEVCDMLDCKPLPLVTIVITGN